MHGTRVAETDVFHTGAAQFSKDRLGGFRVALQLLRPTFHDGFRLFAVDDSGRGSELLDEMPEIDEPVRLTFKGAVTKLTFRATRVDVSVDFGSLAFGLEGT